VRVSGDFVFAVVAFVAIGLVVAILGFVQARRRRSAMADYAASRGWRYAEEEPLLVDRFTGSPFGEGSGRRAFNVVYGSHDGRDFVSFDYEYRVRSSGQDSGSTTYQLSVLALSLGALMPELTVDPEGVLDRFVGRLVGSDIDLESEDFNRAFSVSCPDRKFASDVLHPRMMEFLLQHPHLGWRFQGDAMLTISDGTRTVEDIDATLAVMDGITDLVPEFVWLRLRGQG
jgi:hypothetical protein